MIMMLVRRHQDVNARRPAAAVRLELLVPPRPLSLLAKGHSYQSAADEMIVSINTVRNSIRSVYDKLHVHSKSAAVAEPCAPG